MAKSRKPKREKRAVTVLPGYAMPDVIYNFPLDTKDWAGPLATGSFLQGYNPSSGSMIPAVMRATSIIAETIASMPWRIIRDRDTTDAPKWVNDPQMLRPDARLGTVERFPGSLNRMEFWTQFITSIIWHGNGFIWSAEDMGGMPRPGYPFLKVLNPLDVGWSTEYDEYTIGDVPLSWLGGRLIHVRGLPPYDSYGFGIGVFARHALDLGIASEVRDYTSNTFHSGVPSGYLQVTSQNLDATQAQDLKAAWLKAHGDARTIAVLNSTTQFHPLSISPLDAQLVEQKKMTTQDIAMMFGLDPTFLGAPSGDSATYANVESRQIILVQHTLTPWANRIAETLSAEFPEGTWLEIDMRGLLRGDTAARLAYYAGGLSGEWLTRDEIRSLERLPVLELETEPAQTSFPGTGDTPIEPATEPLALVQSTQEVSA